MLTGLLLLAAIGIGLDGRPTDPFAAPDTSITVLVFVRTDCPISNRYAPELQRISREFSPRKVRFWLVYPDATESPANIRKHLADYSFPGEPMRDPKRELVRVSHVRVTPEVAVFLPGRKLAYHGRIDDRFVDFGKSRAAPTTHDLEATVAALLDGKPVARDKTKAVGCYISDLP